MIICFDFFVLFFLQDDDVNLASSTLVSEGKCPAEAMGIVISYSVRVKVNCGTLGGELITDVPFKLMHPAPGNYQIFLYVFARACVHVVIIRTLTFLL